MRTTTALAFLVMLVSRGWTAAPPTEFLATARMQALIRALGSPDYKVREETTRKLLELDEAEPALQSALVSTRDAEVRRRLRTILATFSRRRMERTLEMIKADAKHGRADLLAMRLVHWTGANDHAVCWQALLDLGYKLLDLDQEKFKRLRRGRMYETHFPPPTFLRYMERLQPHVLPVGKPMVNAKTSPGKYLIRGEQAMIDHVGSSLVAVVDSLRIQSLSNSIVVAGGSINAKACSDLVIFCDGDLTCKEGMGDCIIVARGTVSSYYFGNCLVFAGGDVILKEGGLIRNSTIRSGRNVPMPKKNTQINSDLKGHCRDVLASVRFFETSSLGVEVASAKEGLRVTAAPAGKPFAQARLAVGDRVVSLDGTAVKDAEAFRRLLRKRLVEGGKAVLEVKREGKTLKVQVPLP